MRRASASATAVLPTPGSPSEHHGIRAFAVTEDLDQLLQLLLAAEDRRYLVLPREQIQVDRELLQEGRQLVTLAQFLIAQFDIADDSEQRVVTASPSVPKWRRMSAGPL